MKYYVANKDEKEILLYEYKKIKERLYDYKKKKMGELENKLVNVSFSVPIGCECYFKENEINYIQYDRINTMYPPYVSYSEELQSSKKEQEELLEKFYSGNIKIGEFVDPRPYFMKIDSKLLFSYELGVKKWENGKSIYYTDDIIIVPQSLIILNEMENENINYASKNISKLDEQLDCFEFSGEPIDSVKISTLEDIVGEKEFTKVLEKAKQNSKLLELIKR